MFKEIDFRGKRVQQDILRYVMTPTLAGILVSGTIAYIVAGSPWLGMAIALGIGLPASSTVWLRHYRREQVIESQNAELQKLNIVLDKRTKEMDLFIKAVAHDLKNPINTIVGFSTMQSSLSEDEWDDMLLFADQITEVAYKMEDIVQSLLLVSSLKTEQIVMHRFNMKRLVEETWSLHIFFAEKEKATIEITEDWPDVVGYAPWIEGIWRNFISNAIKYGGKPPALKAGATLLDDGRYKFWLKDNGPGIPEIHREKLFGEFNQLDSGQFKGHGLGLSLVQRLIKKMDGEVGIECPEEGGSIFYFVLPQPSEETS